MQTAPEQFSYRTSALVGRGAGPRGGGVLRGRAVCARYSAGLGLAVRRRVRAGLGRVQPDRRLPRDRQLLQQRLGALGQPVDGSAHAGLGLAVRRRVKSVLGLVQPDRRLPRDRQRGLQQRLGVLGQPVDGGADQVSGSPFAARTARSRSRSARAAATSRPPTTAPATCRCSWSTSRRAR